MFSLESTFNHHKTQDHISWREVQNKSFSHTPTGTKDNSSRDIIQHLLLKTIAPEHILLTGFIFCSASYELRVQLHRRSR